jgi:hypothetical protein
MAPGRARVGGVDVAIGQSIEGHGSTTGKDHAQKDAGQFNPLKPLLDIPSQDGAEQSERKRKQRMTEANQLQQAADALNRAK